MTGAKDNALFRALTPTLINTIILAIMAEACAGITALNTSDQFFCDVAPDVEKSWSDQHDLPVNILFSTSGLGATVSAIYVLKYRKRNIVGFANEAATWIIVTLELFGLVSCGMFLISFQQIGDSGRQCTDAVQHGDWTPFIDIAERTVTWETRALAFLLSALQTRVGLNVMELIQFFSKVELQTDTSAMANTAGSSRVG